MNHNRLKRVIGIALLLLVLLGCGTLSPAPTLPSATPVQPTITSVPGYPLTISVNPDVFLRFESDKLELFDIYCERNVNLDIEQAEVLLQLDTAGERTTIRQGPVAISECSGSIAATNWANDDELKLLFTMIGFKGEGYVRIAFYKAYPSDVSPPSPRPESERLSVWLSLPAEFK